MSSDIWVKTIANKIGDFMAGSLTAAVVGSLTGAIVSSGLLIYYAIWRTYAVASFNRTEPTFATFALRQLGFPPEENILLIFPAVGIGFLLGIFVYLWMRWRSAIS